MATTWATARCPTCAAPLATRVPVAPGARWFTCPHCGSPVPVVAPTSPPPLFTWEVYPQAYPPPPPIRVPTRSIGRLAAIALAACVVILAGLAAALIGGGAEALGSSSYRLSGTVIASNSSAPLPGASLTLRSENGWQEGTAAGAGGTFEFGGIPSGGATLNVSMAGYAPVSLVLFFSPAYRATGSGPGGLEVALTPGNEANLSTVYETSFPTIESFVSSLWSAGVLLLISAVVAAVGAVMAYRERRPAVGVAGGAAAAVAPAALGLLGVLVAFPLSVLPAAAAVGLGMIGAVLELAPVLWAGRAAESG